MSAGKVDALILQTYPMSALFLTNPCGLLRRFALDPLTFSPNRLSFNRKRLTLDFLNVATTVIQRVLSVNILTHNWALPAPEILELHLDFGEFHPTPDEFPPINSVRYRPLHYNVIPSPDPSYNPGLDYSDHGSLPDLDIPPSPSFSDPSDLSDSLSLPPSPINMSDDEESAPSSGTPDPLLPVDPSGANVPVSLSNGDSAVTDSVESLPSLSIPDGTPPMDALDSPALITLDDLSFLFSDDEESPSS